MVNADAARDAAANALAAARQVQAEVSQAWERMALAGADAWEGPGAQGSAGLLRRLAAEAHTVLDSCVRMCEALLNQLRPDEPLTGQRHADPAAALQPPPSMPTPLPPAMPMPMRDRP